MAMGINLYTANVNSSIIDKSMIREVTENIFTRSEAKNNVDIAQKFDLSKFNRAEMGIDLYSNKVNSQQAIEISIRNAGLDVQLNQNFAANVQYLNTQAALNNLQNYQRNIDGKMPMAPTASEKSEVKSNFSMPKTFALTSSAQTNKDKRGSNPFSMFAPAKQQETEKTVEVNDLDWVA